MSSKSTSAAADLRAARAAAAEARLRGNPAGNTSGPNATGQPSSTKVVPAWEPSEKGDSEKRKEFSRLLYRGVIRDNGYKQAAECVETLVKITENILSHPDMAKYRELRAANATIKGRVLDVRGGHEYLIALGFRTRTVNFERQYILDPSLRKMHELRIGSEVLTEAVPEVQARLTGLTSSGSLHASDEAMRRARALAEYEADRDLVKERVRREKLGREARERAAAEQAERADEHPDAEAEVADGEEEGQGVKTWEGPDEQLGDSDGGSDGDFGDPSRTKWGKGQTLGGS